MRCAQSFRTDSCAFTSRVGAPIGLFVADCQDLLSRKAALAKVSEETPQSVLKKTRVFQHTPDDHAGLPAPESQDDRETLAEPEKPHATPKKHLFNDKAPSRNQRSSH